MATFRSVSQAVHFAYLIAGIPASAESIMGKLIRRRLLELGEAMGERVPSSVDLSGLTALEVRGQCAMIRLAVEALLPGPEGWAIKARYGTTDAERDKESGAMAPKYSHDRLIAMRSLCAFLRPSMDTISDTAMMLLIARCVGEVDRLRPTLRDIEAETQVSKSALHRAAGKVSHRLRELENQGLDRLAPIFRREGLIPEEGERVT